MQHNREVRSRVSGHLFHRLIVGATPTERGSPLVGRRSGVTAQPLTAALNGAIAGSVEVIAYRPANRASLAPCCVTCELSCQLAAALLVFEQNALFLQLE